MPKRPYDNFEVEAYTGKAQCPVCACQEQATHTFIWVGRKAKHAFEVCKNHLKMYTEGLDWTRV